jgi:hypothetical protein
MRMLLPLCITGLVGCGGYTTTINDRRAFEPLPMYAEWWVATERCSTWTAPLARIEWFTASSITAQGGIIARGSWRAPHEIVIVRGYESDEITVRHEMLHDLLDGDPEHASATWATCDLIPR